MSSSQHIINNGIAATLRHDADMQARADRRAVMRQSRLVDEAIEDAGDALNKRMALTRENEKLRKERDALAEKVAENEDLLLFWANSSRSYLNTLKFIREHWEPSLEGSTPDEATLKERADFIRGKSKDAFIQLRSLPIEEQRAYREKMDAGERAEIKRKKPQARAD